MTVDPNFNRVASSQKWNCYWVLRYGRGNMRCMKGVYENTDEASPFRRRPDFDLLHLKNGAQDTLPVNQSVYQIKV